MRTQIIAGNWKMNMTQAEAILLVEQIKEALVQLSLDKEVVVCPPFTALTTVLDLVDETDIQVGAQNMYYADNGAYTGEVAPPMLAEIGCNYVILGHSERRQYFGETDELINKKLKAAFSHAITPILCVGESLEQRETNETKRFIYSQLEKGLKDIKADEVARMVIAYEPIWAIGTGKTATAVQAGEVCTAIREKIAHMYNEETADFVRIQYGGSVKGDNAASILDQKDIDGALVGGAALKADEFISIIKA